MTQEEFRRYDLEERLFRNGKAPTPIWDFPSYTDDMIQVEAYAKLKTQRDLLRVFVNQDTKEMMRPQNEWFNGFCRAWNRFERNHPFLIFPFVTATDVPIRNQTKRRLKAVLRYTEWYFLQYGKRVPVLILLTTSPGQGYYPPDEDDSGPSHQAVMMVLPHEPFKRYQIVSIDTAGWTDDYTKKWRDEVLIPLAQTIAEVFGRYPQSQGIQAAYSRPVEGPHLHRSVQGDYGSCSAFSFLLALEIVRTPHARWQEAVERLHRWSWSDKGDAVTQRRMKYFLVNATKVFVYLARLLVRTKNRQGASYQGDWESLLQEPSARRLWRQEYGPKIKKALDKASFLQSQALLGPTTSQLRRMRKLHLKARAQVNRAETVTITKVKRGLKRLKKRSE